MKKILIFSLFLLFSIVAFSQTRIINGLLIGRKSSTTVLKIDSVSTNGTDIKFYKGTRLLNSISTDTIAFSSIGIYKADSIYQKSGSYTSRYDFKTEPTRDNSLKKWKAFGSTMNFVPMCPLVSTATLTLVDGRAYYTLYYLEDSIILTGFKYALTTAGNFIEDQYNGIALYSVSGATLTYITKTANDVNIWKSTANTVASKALPSPVVLAPGFYALGMLYNSSSQTTAPVIQSYSTLVFTLGQGFANNWTISNYLNAPQNDVSTTFSSTTFYGSNLSIPLITGY